MQLKKIFAFKTLCALALFGAHAAAGAVDSASLEIGAGKHTQLVRLGAQWDWQRHWWPSNGSHLGGYWDLTLAQWRGTRYRNVAGATQSIQDVGITPVLRFQGDGASGGYLEAGIGMHLLSEQYDNGGHQLATQFQFGDHVALGYRFGGGLTAALKLQHFSNGGIKHPNGGVNLIVASVGKRF